MKQVLLNFEATMLLLNELSLGNGGIRLGINYSVSNEMKWDE
jgi:hypothetical protein